MERRKFIALIGGLVAVSPIRGRAQQSTGPRRVGVLFPGTLGSERERLINEGLTSELGDQKAVLLARSAEGDAELLRRHAAELAKAVDVILAIASGSLVAARQVSQTVPIVALDLEADPITIGAAQSLNRPGGNVTGIFLDAPEIAGKWIQIIREVIPTTKRVALLYDEHLDQTQLKSAETSAHNVGIETLRCGIDQLDQFHDAFQRAADAKVDAMLVHSSPLFVDRAASIAELALKFRMPTIGLFPVYAKAGGLFSYGPNNFQLFKQAGAIAGKILRGANPAEYPIQRPIYVSFLINLRSARQLQIAIPPSLSALADEVIE